MAVVWKRRSVLILCDLTDEALERQLADQQVCALLVATIPSGLRAWSVAVWLLQSAWYRFSCLDGQVHSRCLSTGGFTWFVSCVAFVRLCLCVFVCVSVCVCVLSAARLGSSSQLGSSVPRCVPWHVPSVWHGHSIITHACTDQCTQKNWHGRSIWDLSFWR